MRVRGRVMMIETSKGLHAWRSAVATSAVKAGIKISEGDVAIKIIAYWVRPQCHVTSEGLPRKSCPPRPRYADCDKLARAICDALAGIAYRNDRQVAVLTVERKWCEENQSTGAMITVEKLPALPLDCLKPSLK
jgi:Holliday junction resolvase RusA-like endonuclease